jgi:anaerobic selenocysteine-containing dehydrogenase
MTETEPMGNKENEHTGLSRRDFIKVGATATTMGAAALALKQGLALTRLSSQAAKAAQLDETIVPTTCALCPSGCGLNVRVVNGKAVKVEGNPLHPLNQGVCCLKGQTSLEILYSPERLAHPRIQMGKRGSGDWKEVPWDDALALVAQKLSDLRTSGNPHKLALLYGEGRGQMRGLVGRFMQAYGSPNAIGRESLAEQATRQATFLTQGINGLPVYDLNNANYVIAFGGNLLEASRNVIVYLGAAAFMRRGRPQRGKLVAVHPRMSLTGVKADEWIPIRPGTYAALALGMANVVINSQLYDADFVRDFTFGFEDFEDDSANMHKGFKSLVLEEYTLERTAAITGVASETIARLAGEFATNRPAVAIMPNEIDELCSGNSLYTAMAVHALNALVGSIDQAGGVLVQRFPGVTAWPDYTPDEVALQGLAQPRVDGAGSSSLPLAISTYQNVPEAILAGQPYPLEALILLNANPVYDMPNGGRTVEALLSAPFVVSLAPTLDESAALADVVLPSSTFLETWGDDYMEGVGYAGISLRQPVVETINDSRDPGDVLLDLAARLGGPLAEALPWKDYRSLVDFRLTGLPAEQEKLVANRFWAEMVYFNAQPGSPAWSSVVGRDRLSAPKDGRFDLFSRELYDLLGGPDDLTCLPHFDLPLALDEETQDAQEYPYLLVMQPLITQTQAWQGIVPTLQESLGLQGHMRWSSWVEINPLAAEALGLEEGDLAWVESPAGRVQAQVHVYAGIWPNAVFLPSGQGHHTLVRWGRGAPAAMLAGANPNQLAMIGSEPLSGQAVKGPLRVKVYRA